MSVTQPPVTVDPQADRIAALEFDLTVARAIANDLQAKLTAAMMHEDSIASKFRKKIQALDNELMLAQRGLSSGCGCPIGVCVRKKGDSAVCWLQWAEGHLLRRAGDIRIDLLTRQSVHPKRFSDAPAPALSSEPPEPTV